MSELQLKTENIEAKIKKLITLHSSSKALNVALEEEKQELTLKIRQQQEQRVLERGESLKGAL